MTEMQDELRSLIDRFGEDAREFYEERAGVREFDGGHARERAEVLALVDTLRRDPLALAGVVVLRVRWGDAWAYVLTHDVDAARESLAERGYAVLGRMDLRAVLDEFGGVVLLTHLR